MNISQHIDNITRELLDIKFTIVEALCRQNYTLVGNATIVEYPQTYEVSDGGTRTDYSQLIVLMPSEVFNSGKPVPPEYAIEYFPHTYWNYTILY